MDDLLALAQGWRAAGQPVALATVVHTWGSSPRPVGSHLVVNGAGDFSGSVSGGCIEGEVIRAAQQVMADGQPQMLEFGVSNEQAWEVGLACGGRVAVYVQSLGAADWLPVLLEAKAARQAVALLVRLADGVSGLWQDGRCGAALSLPDAAMQEIAGRVGSNLSGVLDADAGVFVAVYNPPPRLLLVGAVHIAQALAPMATIAGFDVVLVDPRRAFASGGRFPGVAVCQDWPDEALAQLRPDIATAVVTLSHDPKLDDPALVAALQSPAFYIGALGSRRTHAQRLERLREEGFDDAALGRIHAPVGLDLGGRLPPEIAVSILAQVLAVRHGRGAA